MVETLGDGAKLVLASTSEPYLHYYRGGEIQWRGGAGGVATALDSLMREYSGIWVSLGLGSADKEVADSNGKLKVPPGEEDYVLKRVWISKKEEEGAQALTANSALWPLSHTVYVRPVFQQDAWEQFKAVNEKIAQSVAEEVDEKTVVWINDYQLSLCAAYLKKIKNVKMGFFWHIPWPGLEVFKICPWKEEILEAILSNKVVGFHTGEYVRNFLYCVEKLLDRVSVDWQNYEVTYKEAKTTVKSLPIGIDYTRITKIAHSKTPEDVNAQRRKFEVIGKKFIISVDRMDYTKGIPEKLRAIDYLFTKYPEFIGKVTLLQIGAPTRTTLPEYKKALDETLEATDALNWKYSMGDWKPAIFINEFVSLNDIITLYKAADACLVTSLHDGMNLVSKEYIASNQGNGIIVLSKFAGSANELKEAIQVNPFLVEDIAQGIKTSLEMSEKEKQKRMKQMKKTVAEKDVFKWAADFLQSLAETKDEKK